MTVLDKMDTKKKKKINYLFINLILKICWESFCCGQAEIFLHGIDTSPALQELQTVVLVLLLNIVEFDIWRVMKNSNCSEEITSNFY